MKQSTEPVASTILVLPLCLQWSLISIPTPKSSEIAVVITAILLSSSHRMCNLTPILKTISREAAERCAVLQQEGVIS